MNTLWSEAGKAILRTICAMVIIGWVGVLLKKTKEPEMAALVLVIVVIMLVAIWAFLFARA